MAAVLPRISRGRQQGRPNHLASRGAREFVYEQIHRERLEYPPGTQAVYSDLGFLLLGELVELVAQAPLDRVCHERIFRPLGLRSTGFVDLRRLRRDKLAPVTDAIAPTERCPWRGKILCGEVHDDNAWAVGGVAGHAGLFSTAADVHTLVCWLRACARGERLDPARRRSCARFWTRDGTVPDSTWALGWDTPSAHGLERRHAASARTPSATSASPARRCGSTSSATRTSSCSPTACIPSRHDERIREVRPRVHDAVWEALDA